MIALIGLAVSILFGWTIVDAATRDSTIANATGMKLGFAVAAGLGCSSLVSFGCMLVGAPAAGHPAELLAALAITAVSRRTGKKRERIANSGSESRFANLSLVIGTLVGTATFVADCIRNRYGWFDAWTFWMLRARFIDRLGGAWPEAFSKANHFSYAHLDYPLLFPSLVASAWRDAGSESPIFPHFITALFLAATIALLVTSVSHLAGHTAGAAAGIAILSITEMSQVASWLYADVPLACYLLATVVLVTLAAKEARPGGLLVLAGLMAGLAPWTKNDGWSLLLATLPAFLAAQHGRPTRAAASFGSGLLGPLAALVVFKSRFSPASDLLRNQNPATALSRLLDPARYWTIVRAASVYLSTVAIPVVALALALAFLGVRWSRERAERVLPGTVIVVTVGSIYGAVYLLTPFDLAWHLHTSLSRLALHLWPSFLFLLMLLSSPSAENRGEAV